MFAINDAAKAKKSARALEKFLKKHGSSLGHGQALNAVAAMAGFEDWNGLQAQLESAPATDTIIPNIWDVDFQKVNVVNVFGGHYTIGDLDDIDVLEWLSDWDNAENPLRGRNPVALRLESQNEDVHGSVKLRVKELLSFRWDAKQQCFVSPEQGRMSLYCLAPYPFTSGVAKSDPVTHGAHEKTSVHAEPTILDVDFSRVTGMKKGGEGFWVDSRYYPEALAWLHDWNNPANDYDRDVPVLELTYIDDSGFVAHTQILADELLALKWSPALGAFVNSDGVEYAFTAEQSIIPGTLPRCLPIMVKSEVSGPSPTRYEVDVYSIDSDEEACSGREHVDTWTGVAFTVQEAESKALAEVWDDALEASGAEPSCDVREVDDAEDGPFHVFIVDGHSMHNASTSFKDACTTAARLSRQYLGVQDVTVLDSQYNSLYTFKKN
jgi:hypothetical protein